MQFLVQRKKVNLPIRYGIKFHFLKYITVIFDGTFLVSKWISRVYNRVKSIQFSYIQIFSVLLYYIILVFKCLFSDICFAVLSQWQSQRIRY